ncbi:MAG: hypothetical protein ACOC5T_03180 [Elusimicrobiota bacterium]
MDFQFFYLITEYDAEAENSDWRQKRVWHRTPSGQRNRVKVKSLPPDEQWKYAPLSVKLKRKQKDPHAQVDQPQAKPKTKSFTFYYSADRPKGFDEFDEGKLVVATDDSAKAIEIEKKGHKIAVAHQVPIDAIKKYWNYDKKEWKSFPKDISEDRKYELIKFSDDDVYLVDFAKFKDQIDFQLSDPEEKEDEK